MSISKVTREESLAYHSGKRKGKIEVVSTKPCLTQRDLSMAYTPGVAEPCREIEKNPELAYEYTAKGNLVAVISNGTAVLGLGNIGAIAGKPVMEGKGVLFKRFADIDVFDIEVNSEDPDEIVRFCQLIEPTLGGINLEDIKAPECFYIEETLKKSLNIPVFHDDQHGTAIISGAAFLNALELNGKPIDEVKVVFNGAGASGIACAKLYRHLGVRPENLTLVDTKGVVYKGRTAGMNPYKEDFAVETDARTLADAMRGADVFVGLSGPNVVVPEMLLSMAEEPIVFAMANPDPEITYDLAVATRKDIIMATGRSDYPNQVNNVLGFPFIFRGALDVRASDINEEMKMAAVKALAALTKEDVPDSVIRAYGGKPFKFGREYLIPKPFDYRVLLWEAPAVAEAAIQTGVARKPYSSKEDYIRELENRLSRTRQVMHFVFDKAKEAPKRIVFAEGTSPKIVQAAKVLAEEKICTPVLLGPKPEVEALLVAHEVPGTGVEVVEPAQHPRFEEFVSQFHTMRWRRGVAADDARKLMKDPVYFGNMMVHAGEADGLISGLTMHYPDTIRPALQIHRTAPEVTRAAGLYLLLFKERMIFVADTTVNEDPSAEQLAEIAWLAAQAASTYFEVEPRIAMLSYANFGSVTDARTAKVRQAVEIFRKRWPQYVIDGEMQADSAVEPVVASELYPLSAIQGDANILVCPDLESANILYKLLWRLGKAEAIGPILMGVNAPVHVLQRGVEVGDIVNMAAMCVLNAQRHRSS